MHKSQSLFNLITALHVSGITITCLQEHKTTAATASGNHYTVLLSAAVVEELELIWVCCRWRVHATYNTPAAIVKELELIWVCCTWCIFWNIKYIT